MKQTGWGVARFLSARRNWPSYRQRLFLLIFGLTLAFTAALVDSPVAHAEPVQTAKLSPNDRADVKRIETYLNQLKTLTARFLQVSSNGGYAEGLIYISRPGKMRIDYAPPAMIEIVADGKDLIYHDKELEQVSHIDLVDTPANILLQKKIRLLRGPLRVKKLSRGPGILRVSLVKKEDPDEGMVTLVFSDRPLALKKWTITDAQGIITTVSLLRTRFGLPISPKIFEFKDPDYELFQDGS